MFVTSSLGMVPAGGSVPPYGFRIVTGGDAVAITPYRLMQAGESLPGAVDGGGLDPVLAGKPALIGAAYAVSFQDLTARWEVQDYSCVVFPLARYTVPQIRTPYNRHAENVNTKRDAGMVTRLPEIACIHLFVPFVADPTGWALHVLTHPDAPLLCDGAVTVMARDDAFKRAMPAIRLAGDGTVAAGAYAEVNVSLVDSTGAPIEKDTILYLENTGGYLPLRRVPVTKGKGTFKVGALGLEAGDTFRVKADFRLFSGLAEINLKVT